MNHRTVAAAALAILVSVGGSGCSHMDRDRILMLLDASFEGGSEVAVLELRVWNRKAECEEIIFEDNEVWVGWSHLARSHEYGDSFQIGAQLSLEQTFVTGSDDGRLVYYSFGTLAEIADRHGNIVVELGQGMRTAAFYTANDTAVVEGPDGFLLVRLVDKAWTEIDVKGTGPSFEPGGDRIVYGRDAAVYIYDFADEAEHALGDGLWPRYLDDGRVLAYKDGSDGPGLYSITPGSGGWSYYGDPDPGAIGAPWWRLAPDGQRLLVDTGDGGYTLQAWSGPEETDWRYDSELFCDY